MYFLFSICNSFYLLEESITNVTWKKKYFWLKFILKKRVLVSPKEIHRVNDVTAYNYVYHWFLRNKLLNAWFEHVLCLFLSWYSRLSIMRKVKYQSEWPQGCRYPYSRYRVRLAYPSFKSTDNWVSKYCESSSGSVNGTVTNTGTLVY